MLSGMSRGAGLVLTAKNDVVLKHVEFIRLEPTKALAVLVGDHNQVENRIIELPTGISSSQLTEAANFINAHLSGQTLQELRGQFQKQQAELQSELGKLAQDLIERGLAVWAGDSEDGKLGRLIVRGRSNLLEGLAGEEDIDRVRLLFDDLERKENLIEILNLAESGSGVRIFIGSENKLFSLSGSSLIVAPYRDEDNRVVGAVGVIGAHQAELCPYRAHGGLHRADHGPPFPQTEIDKPARNENAASFSPQALIFARQSSISGATTNSLIWRTS